MSSVLEILYLSVLKVMEYTLNNFWTGKPSRQAYKRSRSADLPLWFNFIEISPWMSSLYEIPELFIHLILIIMMIIIIAKSIYL